MKIIELHNLIEAVCPIHGVSSNGVISFHDDATDEQRMAAASLMDTHLSEVTVGELPYMTDIMLLEATITPRRLRDAVLTESGKQWLVAVELEINNLRKQLTKGK